LQKLSPTHAGLARSFAGFPAAIPFVVFGLSHFLPHPACGLLPEDLAKSRLTLQAKKMRQPENHPITTKT
jgi:hypothetical protein